MKKVIGMAIGCLAANLSYAQSSVTLYGVVDDGIQYTNNQAGASSWALSQGGRGSSKWGMTGTEDLGGGLHAFFKLENGFNLNNGALGNNGALFGRQGYVGLGSDKYGEVRLGRQYDLLFESLVPFAASGKFGGGLGAHAGDVDNTWGDFNLNNTVKYLSPTLYGARLGVAYSFGNVAGSMGRNQAVNVSLTYGNGPLTMAAAYLKVNNPATAVWGATSLPVAGAAYTNPVSSPIYRGYATADAIQISGAAANYKLGNSNVSVLFTSTQLQDAVKTTTTPLGGSAHFNTLEGDYTYNLTPALQLATAYAYTWANDARYGQVNLGATYNLSKRTFLYAIGAWQHATGKNSLGAPAVAANTNITASSTDNQVAVRLGIRHSF
ncbi:outer membrane porin OpcP [Caballeronia sordidicola]|uniref:Outer membrane porin OpcP n=1 Tax=Caballeronia sordidicola TaxID=196367 RepID=A0A158FFY9_CABSO|nr:porin [Caballeronia sordidicola]SAL18655.1 outer membrane porin OpcP [Caballeronia sordidicola]